MNNTAPFFDLVKQQRNNLYVGSAITCLRNIKAFSTWFGVSDQVIVYCYGGRVVEMWFAQNSVQFERLKNLTVISLPVDSTRAIAKMAQRNMKLNCTIQDGQVWLGNGDESVMIELVTLKAPPVCASVAN